MFRRTRTVFQLTRLLGSTGRWWLVPMVLILILAAIIVIAVQVVEYAAPFVYTVF